MNRTEMIEAVAEKADLSSTAATKAVAAVLDTITDTLKDGGEVRLVGFGTFSVAERAAYKGRNPRTGEPIEIAASRKAKWKPGKTLNGALSGAGA